MMLGLSRLRSLNSTPPITSPTYTSSTAPKKQIPNPITIPPTFGNSPLPQPARSPSFFSSSSVNQESSKNATFITQYEDEYGQPSPTSTCTSPPFSPTYFFSTSPTSPSEPSWSPTSPYQTSPLSPATTISPISPNQTPSTDRKLSYPSASSHTYFPPSPTYSTYSQHFNQPQRRYSTPDSPASSTSYLPLSPPPRLHHRSILPTPPVQRRPSTPAPWIWKCHLCSSIWRLGVTRRCLEDGHYFCSIAKLSKSPSPSPSPPTSPRKQTETETSLSSTTNITRISDGTELEVDPNPDSDEEVWNEDASALSCGSGIGYYRRAQNGREKSRVQRVPRKRKRKEKVVQGVGCETSFDYKGWSKWQMWRRRGSIDLVGEGGSVGARGSVGRSSSVEGRELVRWEDRRSCWGECTFPSECVEKERSRVFREVARNHGWRCEGGWRDVDVDVDVDEGIDTAELVNGREGGDGYEEDEMEVYQTGYGGGGDKRVDCKSWNDEGHGQGLVDDSRGASLDSLLLGKCALAPSSSLKQNEQEKINSLVDDILRREEINEISRVGRKSWERMDMEPDSPLKSMFSADFQWV